ncbi:hypothetical protein JCM10213_004667 [Rhodosporidiobolus nylandii]
MLRTPLRSLRGPLKLIVLAVTLLALYKALSIVLPGDASTLQRYSDSAPPVIANFDLARERSGRSAANSDSGSGGDGTQRGSGARGLREEGGAPAWAPRGGAPPRRAEEKPHLRGVPPPLPLPPRPPPARPAGKQDGATYEEELKAAQARREGRMPKWDERVAAAGERRKDAAVAEDERAAGRMERRPRPEARRRKRPEADEDVDGERELRGAPARKQQPPAARKKAPLVQVGGVQHAAGQPDALERAEKVAAVQAAAAARGKKADQWRGKGWDQRFRKQATGEDSEGEMAEETVEDDGLTTTTPDDPAAPSLLEHALVRRLASGDFSVAPVSEGGTTPPDPTLEDSFQADNAAAPPSSLTKRYNLTVCALVPNEQRFLTEWLLYHRLLGVERFALYDTSHPGAFGAAEVDALADKMTREGGSGDLGPTVDELKDQADNIDAGPGGLDARGQIRAERIEGLERWIDQGVVKLHWMKFDSKSARDFLEHMLEHCQSTYGPSSEWLATLDVDEFLSVSSQLYGASEPYISTPTTPEKPSDPLDPSDPSDSSVAAAGEGVSRAAWRYPLHDVLAREQLADAACVPVPVLNYRNLAVRELKKGQGVLEVQTHRDVLKQGKKVLREEGLQQKTLIHTVYSTSSHVSFVGPHSCKVESRSEPGGVSPAVKNSQGTTLQDGGLYEVAKLPIEPLAIAHYLQRDLRDCFSKLSSLSDPLDLHAKSRGAVACESHYLPSPQELASRSFLDDPENRFLAQTPAEGSVVVDLRMRDSWAARAAAEVRRAWARKGRKTTSAPADVVERARRSVEVLSF